MKRSLFGLYPTTPYVKIRQNGVEIIGYLNEQNYQKTYKGVKVAGLIIMLIGIALLSVGIFKIAGSANMFVGISGMFIIIPGIFFTIVGCMLQFFIGNRWHLPTVKWLKK